ncbi:hypothetical protein DYB38_005731, partial [Aphanomyces astaci]
MLIRHALQALDDAIVEALATVPSKDAKKSFKKKQGKHAAHHDATSSNETSGALYDVLTLCEPLTNDMDAMVLESEEPIPRRGPPLQFTSFDLLGKKLIGNAFQFPNVDSTNEWLCGNRPNVQTVTLTNGNLDLWQVY